MNYSPNTLLVIVVAFCAVLLIAKLLKVEKAAAVLGVVVIIVWLILHFTGYDETVYNILFNPPPLKPQSPFNR